MIKRSRGFYLYTEQHTRLVDFSLAYGTALLGHRPLKLQGVLKRALDVGFSGVSSNKELARVDKHVSHYLAGWRLCAIIHASTHTVSQHHFCQSLGIPRVIDLVKEVPNQDISTIVQQSNRNEGILWRPFSSIDSTQILLAMLQQRPDNQSNQFLITPVPFSWGEGMMMICVPHTFYNQDSPYIEISTVLLSGVNYIIPYLIQKGPLQRVLFPESKNRSDILVLDTHTHSKYQYTSLPLREDWHKQGIYIVLPQYTKEQYQNIWNVFFNLGFYLPEVQGDYVPQILTTPAYITRYELSQWKCAIAHKVFL